MGKKILLAGVLGGIALFCWGALSHTVLGIGEIGIKELPQEQMVLQSLQVSINEPGFYFFPGMSVPANATAQQKQAATERYQQRYTQGPNGILIYQPTGSPPMSARQLLTELGLNVVQALIAAWLLSMATVLTTFVSRASFVVVLGILASISTNIQYWNWYHFPAYYTTAYILNQILGFVIVGIAAAAIVRPSKIAIATPLAKAA